jgi:glycosyltransferase involved in cell wall biosynthesis
MENNKIKICSIATLQSTIKSFMLGNLKYVSEHGYDSYCISSPGNILSKELLGDVTYIPMEEIKWGVMSPVSFYRCVRSLYNIFKKEQFDIIQYATSNAALCASVAGWLAKVPVRINLQWGIAYPVHKGWKRWLFYYSTIIICKLSTSVQPDSKGNLAFSIKEKLYPAAKGEVLYNGSACGVDLKKYDIGKRQEWRKEIFAKHHLDSYKRIFGFVGRVVVEKGINELIEAFLNLNIQDTCLILVGPLDDVQRLNQDFYRKAQDANNIIIVGPVDNAAKYYAAFDFMMLPSYQEGFGMTILEAAGVGTPSIISNIKGPTELIKDGVNGLICEPCSVESLQATLKKACMMTSDEYKSMANNAYEIAYRDFDAMTFKEKFLENRKKLLAKKI